MSQIRRWTDEDVSVLKELLDKGWLYKDIAMELGRTREATKSKARDLGLVSKWTNTKSGENFGKEFNKAYEDFVYVGGYINNKSAFTLRCRKCDNVFERNAIVMGTRKNIVCEVCARLERHKKALVIEKARMLRTLKNKLKRIVSDMERNKQLEERNKQLENHVCKECLNRFKATIMGTAYCSDTCKWRVAGRKRRHRIRENGKVENIRLGQLIVRDNNVCYLCNECCDREDYTITTDGHFIVGETYPSIDHVVPINKGGTHTWDNVKLACFSCNAIKSDNLIKEPALMN